MHLIKSATVFICLCINFTGVWLYPQSSSDLSRENENWRALHTAIEDGNFNEFERLITNGVDINATDEITGNSALILATSKGLTQMVKKLLENRVDINAVNKFNETALILALVEGNESIVRLLVENGANLSDAVANINNSAVNGEIEETAQVVIKDIHAVNSNKSVALLLAAARGREKSVKLLLDNGADIDVVTIFNNSPLLFAISAGHNRIAEFLIRNGADVNIRGQFGKTALIWAAQKGFDRIVQMIIDKGANVDVVDDEDNTAFMYAAQNLWIAMYSRDQEIPGADAKIAGYERTVQILLERSKSINAVGEPLLVVAVLKGHEKAAELLVRNGTNTNTVNKHGITALMAAVQTGNENLIKLLLENSTTNVNAVNRDGLTALDIVNTDIEGYEKLKRLLEQHGAEYKGVELYRRASLRACQLYSNLTARWRYGTRVLDGSSVQLGEFPWMVALGYLNKQFKVSFQCGGSLISDIFVLTAAHCVKSIQRPVVARLGKTTLSDEDDFRAENQNIQQIFSHPKYSTVTKKNDIALIRLIDRLAFTEFIQPICINTDLSDVDPNVSLTVTGWGVTESGRSSNDLLKIDLKTMPLSECNTNLLDYNKNRNQASLRNGVDRSQYCAHDPVGKKDSCQGDSGGPLQTDHSLANPAKLVGVVSFGIGCGRGRPGIYTRVAHYIDWIGPHVWPNGTIYTPQININAV